jgi:hypothetical protein
MTEVRAAQTAAEWLRVYLRTVGGRSRVRDALSAARAAGFGEPAIHRAARTIGIRVELHDGDEWWSSSTMDGEPDRTDSEATEGRMPTPGSHAETTPSRPVRVPTRFGAVAVADLEAATHNDERLWHSTR